MFWKLIRIFVDFSKKFGTSINLYRKYDIKKMKKNILMLVATVMAVVSCSRSVPAKADIWTEKKDTLEISMPDNPSTGYSWRMKGSRICDSVGFRYKQDIIPGDSVDVDGTIYRNGYIICGRGGTATYLISGRTRGIDTIRFERARFEGDSVVEERQYILGFR